MAVVHALAADLPMLARTLARAFHDDPLMAWVYPDAEQRRVRLPDWMGLLAEAGLQRGHTYHAGEGGAAAIWSPPDVPLIVGPWATRFGAMVQEHAGSRAEEIGAGFAQLGQWHPRDEPYFYLSTLGTDPEHQGKGLGAELVRHVLRICDADGRLAYLESSNAANVGFYEHLGFQVVGEIEMAPGGPVVRPMRRKASAGGAP